jgi:hypothetical protein
MREQPKHWRPFTEYLERFGERNRAAGQASEGPAIKQERNAHLN